MIDERTWRAVESLIAGRRRAGRPWRRSKLELLLHGLARCAACGSRMTGRYSKRGGRRYYYYTCLKALKEGAAACPQGQVPARVLEERVLAELRAAGRERKVLARILAGAEAEREERRRELEARLLALEEEGVRLELARGELLSGARDGRRGLVERLGEVERELEEKESEAADIRSAIEALAGAVPDPEEVEERIRELESLWEKLFPRERGELLRRLLAEVAWDGRISGVRLRFRADREFS